jgi:hypothetical protein
VTVITPFVRDGDCHSLFEAADVKKVKELDLDVIVDLGTCEPRGELLKASRSGVISVLYGRDNLAVRAGPPGFWEVYYRQETTGFAIVHLQDDVNAPAVTARGDVVTRHYYLLNQAFVARKACHYLKRVVEQIASSGEYPRPLLSFPYAQPVLGQPSLIKIMLYLGMRCWSIALKRATQTLGVEYRSTVAYLHKNWTDAALADGIRLANQPMHCLADPFVLRRNDRTYCFVEDLDYATQRGSIDVYELGEAGSIRLGSALQESFHLSFPYMFEYSGELYMCPESSENRDIRIYKCVEFPHQWRLETIAMKDISAVDSMIFERDGKWWMLTNIDPLGIGDHCSELFLFSASSPLNSEWKPHPQNPVLIDASRARNAGYLSKNGRFYRCSQGQGFNFYGKRVLINEIVELSETSYREICLSVITPTFGGGAAGTHHLHADGAVTVFDFVTNSRIATGNQAPSPTRLSAALFFSPIDQANRERRQTNFSLP